MKKPPGRQLHCPSWWLYLLSTVSAVLLVIVLVVILVTVLIVVLVIILAVVLIVILVVVLITIHSNHPPIYNNGFTALLVYP